MYDLLEKYLYLWVNTQILLVSCVLHGIRTLL